MATPVGPRPALFTLVAVLHGVLAVAFVIGLVVFIRVFVKVPEEDVTLGQVFELIALAFMLVFILLVIAVFTAQTVNAITLLTRRGEVVGSYDLGRRFMQVLPLPTTRWSRFWIAVQVRPWMHWRLLLAAWLLAICGLSFTRWAEPVALVITAVLALGGVVALAISSSRTTRSAPAPK